MAGGLECRQLHAGYRYAELTLYGERGRACCTYNDGCGAHHWKLHKQGKPCLKTLKDDTPLFKSTKLVQKQGVFL